MVVKEFKLKLTDEVHQILKERAKRDFRSMQSYIELWLAYITTQEYQPAPTPAVCPEMKGKIVPRYQARIEQKEDK